MRLLSRVTLYYFAAPQASLSNVVFSASRNHFVTQCGQIARTRQTNFFVGGCWAILYSCAWDTRRIILGSHINTRALLSSYNYWLNIAFHSRKFFPCSSPARESVFNLHKNAKSPLSPGLKVMLATTGSGRPLIVHSVRLQAKYETEKVLVGYRGRRWRRLRALILQTMGLGKESERDEPRVNIIESLRSL